MSFYSFIRKIIMVFTENANYDPIDEMELEIDMDIEISGSKEYLQSLVKGKSTENINKALLIKNIKEQIPSYYHEECIFIAQRDLGIVLTQEDIAA